MDNFLKSISGRASPAGSPLSPKKSRNVLCGGSGHKPMGASRFNVLTIENDESISDDEATLPIDDNEDCEPPATKRLKERLDEKFEEESVISANTDQNNDDNDRNDNENDTDEENSSLEAVQPFSFLSNPMVIKKRVNNNIVNVNSNNNNVSNNNNNGDNDMQAQDIGNDNINDEINASFWSHGINELPKYEKVQAKKVLLVTNGLSERFHKIVHQKSIFGNPLL